MAPEAAGQGTHQFQNENQLVHGYTSLSVPTISMKAEAAAVGVTSCSVHMSTLRAGMVKSVFSSRMSPASASCTNSWVTPAAQPDAGERHQQLPGAEFDLRGQRDAALEEILLKNTRLLALRSSRMRGKAAISCRV